MKRFTVSFAILFLFVITVADAQTKTPWFKSFTPVRTINVSSTGALRGALGRAKPGDLILVEDGVYSGLFRLSKSGTEQHPIVLRAKNHAKIQGAVNITGAHNWVWGFEITDPNGSVKASDACLRLAAPGARAINNYVHHPTNKNSAAAWEKGSGQLLYGNIIHDGRHNLYTQNNFDRFGYKYIVGNVLLDSAPEPNGSNSFNFHAYTERSHISGFHVEKNVFAGGRWLMGGFGEPHHHEVVKSNYFYEFGPELGYRSPLQIEFTNNFLGNCGLQYQWLWGAGETSYSQTLPTRVSGNHIIPESGKRHVDLKTSAYVNGQLQVEGRVRFRADDFWNQNTYYGSFTAALAVNGVFHAGISRIVDWKNYTRTFGGNAFDLQSRIAPRPRGSKSFLIANEYDKKRAFVVVYNWSGAQQVNFNLPRAGAVYSAKGPFEPAVASGVSVKLPLNGKKFGVFLVRFFS